jgi:hypothetical protein
MKVLESSNYLFFNIGYLVSCNELTDRLKNIGFSGWRPYLITGVSLKLLPISRDTQFLVIPGVCSDYAR